MARNHGLQVFDRELIEVRRTNEQQGLTDGSQYSLLCSAQIPPSGKGFLHTLRNDVHVLAAKDLAGQNDINNMIFTELVEI